MHKLWGWQVRGAWLKQLYELCCGQVYDSNRLHLNNNLGTCTGYNLVSTRKYKYVHEIHLDLNAFAIDIVVFHWHLSLNIISLYIIGYSGINDSHFKHTCSTDLWC